MTHIQRFTALVAAIKGHEPSNADLNMVATDFIVYRRNSIEAAGLDPDNLTNAQKASVVLDAIDHHMNSVSMAMLNKRIAEKLKAA